MVYLIKRRLLTNSGSISVLKPDHVSLAKCVTCHQFIRKYSTIQSLAVINMIRDGCEFKGFKKMHIESTEEEGFVNMHHVLVIESLGGEKTKQVCVQRKNVIKVSISELKNKNEVVTDTRSVVLIVYNPEGYIEFFHFGKLSVKKCKMDVLDEPFTLILASDIMYIYFEQSIRIFNFKYDHPFEKRVSKMPLGWFLLIASSNEMLVWCRATCANELKHENRDGIVGPKLILIDDLEKGHSPIQLVLSQELITDVINAKVLIVRVNDSTLWITAGQTNFSVYLHTNSNELNQCKSFELSMLYPDSESFLYTRSCYCSCTQQIFLMYIRDEEHNACSFIVALDLKLMQIVNVLEMELTLNRKPELFMYPSTDGSKLFVQETFENRVVFYQVFSLVPSGLSLQNISKQFIWNHMTDVEVKNAVLPTKLKEELMAGL